jgi:hypothetical protein
VHISAVERAGLSSLNEGAKGSYERDGKQRQNLCGESKGPLKTAHSTNPAGLRPAGFALAPVSSLD